MASTEQLQRQAQELRSAMRELTRQQAKLKREAKATLPASPTPWMRSVALKVFALAGDDACVAAEYLRWKGRSVSVAEMRALGAGLSEDDRQALVRPPVGEPRAARQLAEARKFIAERTVVTWVRQQNTERGIAPTPGAIIDEFASSAGPAGRRSSRHKWLRRLSSRWGGRKAVFRNGDQLPKEVLEHKARPCCLPGHLLAKVAARLLEPRCGPKFGTPKQASSRKVPNPGTIFGSPIGAASLAKKVFGGDQQARACWKWSNFIRACNTEGKPVLHVNLDETSLKLHVPALPGLVFEPCRKRRRRLLREGHVPDLGTRRAAVTLVAFACNDQRVQKLLPQIFVVNKRVVLADDVVDFDERCTGNVIIARRESSWVTANFMVEVVRALAFCLSEEMKSHHVVLHLDACRSHSHVKVLKECASAGIFVHFVPAGTTAWLQPLDVSVFSKFKSRVVRDVERKRLAALPGPPSRPEMLEIYRKAVVDVIQSQSWARAFELTGLLGQGKLSQRLMDRIGLAAAPAVGDGVPSLPDLEVTFPAGMNIPIEELFELALAQERSRRAVRIPVSAKLPRGRGLL